MVDWTRPQQETGGYPLVSSTSLSTGTPNLDRWRVTFMVSDWMMRSNSSEWCNPRVVHCSLLKMPWSLMVYTIMIPTMNQPSTNLIPQEASVNASWWTCRPWSWSATRRRIPPFSQHRWELRRSWSDLPGLVWTCLNYGWTLGVGDAGWWLFNGIWMMVNHYGYASWWSIIVLNEGK